MGERLPTAHRTGAPVGVRLAHQQRRIAVDAVHRRHHVPPQVLANPVLVGMPHIGGSIAAVHRTPVRSRRVGGEHTHRHSVGGGEAEGAVGTLGHQELQWIRDEVNDV